MNFSWPWAAGKAARRGAARAGLVGIAAAVVAGAAALAAPTAPAMSAMAATLNPTTTIVTNPFPITGPEGANATVNVEVVDDTADGPAPTGTVNVTTVGAYNPGLPAGTVYQCEAPATLAAAATPNGEGLAYSTGSCTFTGLGYGFIEVEAYYSGDDENAASNTAGTEVKIINLEPTITTVATADGTDEATANEQVELVATVNVDVLAGYSEIFDGPAPADTVEFTITGANGSAACTNVPLEGLGDPTNYADCDVTLPAGTYAVTAVFAGDEYAATSTGTATLTVNAVATTTTMAGVSGYVGSEITLAARVTGGSTPTGTVNFVWDGTTLCSASLSDGAAHCTYAFGRVGSLKVEADYGGDATHSASEGLATVKVKALPTSVKVTASPASTSTGKAVKLTATVKSSSPATGTVTFYVGGRKLCTAKVSGGKASCSYTWHAAGSYKVTAAYGGNSTHLASKGTAWVTVKS